MFTMLQSGEDVLENVYVALVKALGTMLLDGVDSAAGEGIMLRHEDEKELFQPGSRECGTIASALSDLKIFSAGLVEWLESEPSVIEQGQ